MLAGIRKRLARKTLDIKEEDDDKDDIQAFTPPTNYITISEGKIQLVHQQRSQESDISDTKSRKERSHCVSPTFEKELREQLDNMNRVIKSKERKQKITCPGHKTLQTRLTHQETLLRTMQQENYTLKRSIRHYERCLDDVMRKVVDAIVAEDILREEVTILKNRVRDLEAQNAALSASPAKGRDEGYCTMSSGQPQPSNGHLEDLPEEPEQWLLPAEPCSTEMEDWSMSQEELPIVVLSNEQQQLRGDMRLTTNLRRPNGENDWIWNSNDFLTSTTAETDSESEAISQLLQQKIVYSEDEDIARTEFTNEFYKLVDIRTASARSLFSYIEGETDDEDDDDEDGASSLSGQRVRLRNKTALNGNQLKTTSPTPSEAGRAQVTSCSSSESDEQSRCTTTQHELNGSGSGSGSAAVQDSIEEEMDTQLCGQESSSDIEIEDIQLEPDVLQKLNEQECIEAIIRTELRRPTTITAGSATTTNTTSAAPSHAMVKSKSMMHKSENELNGLNGLVRKSGAFNGNELQRPPRFMRSESVNDAVINGSGGSSRGSACSAGNGFSRGSPSAHKLQERLQQRPTNSWRKSSGWKRVTTPTSSPTTPLSPQKEVKTEFVRNGITVTTPKLPPTRIPTSVQQQSPPSPKQNQSAPIQFGEVQPQSPQSPQHQQQQQPIRKSKIPPPVPVRRSYAS
ncbi:uro-adherence factor A isoform X2 [Eurosta solidaginis]|uniref:uro-adherence factor A isoform X2 n=1 Tax=Eurosta solidaginis TaxID=178769 RepID=UPI003530F0A6